MTIIYTAKKIHDAKDSLIVIPTTIQGLIRSTAIDDFMLHKLGDEVVHPFTHNVRPGMISYKDNETNTFAFCYCSFDKSDYDERMIAYCLNLVKEYAIEIDKINDIAVDLSSFVVRPGGSSIIKLLNEIFPDYTVTVYLGFPHFPFLGYGKILKEFDLRDYVLFGGL